MTPDQPKFSTTDVVSCREYISRDTGTHIFEPSPGGQFSAFAHWAANLGSLLLNRVELNCANGFNVAKAKRASYFSFQFVQKGKCYIDSRDGQVFAGPGDVFILGPDRISEEHWLNDCEQFVVRIEQSEIETAAAELFGKKLPQIRFRSVSSDPGIAGWLSQAYESLIVSADTKPSLLGNSHVSSHLGQTLVMMLLTGLEHSNSSDIRPVESHHAPYYVKRVERFFQQQYATDICMNDVISAAGVSMRTVFYGFQRWRGTSPMIHLRDLRLALARKELQQGRTSAGAVSAAALSVGFSNFGQFSKLYRARFGENPSETVSRSRN